MATSVYWRQLEYLLILAQLLMTRFQRAHQTMEVAQGTLIKLMSEGILHWIACWLYVISIMLLCWNILTEHLTDDDIKCFLDEEQSLVREKTLQKRLYNLTRYTCGNL